MSDLTPAQRIEAAIVRLEKLRGMSTPGPWHEWEDDLTNEMDIWHDQEVRSHVANFGLAGTQWVVEDAQLVVTLHATIDPTLELLKIELDYARAKGGIVDELFLPLADAIISWGTE